MKHLALSLLAAVVLSLGACQSGPAPADDGGQAAVNAVCPMMPSHEIDTTCTSEWNGQTIAFCCEGCVPKWEALSDEEKATKLAASME